MDLPVCVICFVLVGRRACSAITTIAGDAICADHVALRVEFLLPEAIAEARADLGIVPR